MSASRILWLLPIVACITAVTAGTGLAGIQKSCTARSERQLETNDTAFAALVRRRVVASHRPAGKPVARFGRFNVNGFPTVFSVRSFVVDRSCRTRFLRVQLPMRPNGVTGYVPARAMSLLRIRTRIEVDKSSRRLKLFRGGRRLLQTRVAIGKASTPTPIGRFYVNQLLVPARPSGSFGPGALGISAFSNVLTDWSQGGPIAIHGTNQPWSIGRAASDGCIRVRNGVVRRLLRLVPAGTPVVVHP